MRRIHVTLAYLHHIYGLSDFFLYLNDDMMMSANFDSRTLFDSKGFPIQRLGATALAKSAERALRRLAKDFPLRSRSYDAHVPFMVKKCLMEEIEARSNLEPSPGLLYP